MHTTDSQLLNALRDRDNDPAWSAFYDLYYALLRQYARGYGLRDYEADEVAAECLKDLLRDLPRFQYDRNRGRFRSFLRRAVGFKVSDLRRKRKMPVAAEDELLAQVDGSAGVEAICEHEWLKATLTQGMRHVRGKVSEKSFAAFVMYGIQNKPAELVAQQLSMPINQVYLSKHRILNKLQSHIREMIDRGN